MVVDRSAIKTLTDQTSDEIRGILNNVMIAERSTIISPAPWLSARREWN
jgi:hypothetical protein